MVEDTELKNSPFQTERTPEEIESLHGECVTYKMDIEHYKRTGEVRPVGVKTKMDIARGLLPKERLTEELEAGKSLSQIARENNLEPWQVSQLKQEYQLDKPEKNEKKQEQERCTCDKPCARLLDLEKELAELKEKVKRTGYFLSNHRHQVGPGHYSEKGVV